MPNSLNVKLAPAPSNRQRLFDFLFGVVAPWLCVYFDPAIFRADVGSGPALLASFRFFGYLEIAIGTLALAYYLLARRPSPLLAGILFSGAIFSFVLGVAMLPYTLLGLVLIIGILGFLPFFTAFIYFRNTMRCWKAPALVPREAVAAKAALATFLALAVPAALQGYTFHATKRALVTLESGSDQDAPAAVATLRRFHFAFDDDELAFAYQRASTPAQRDRLASAFLRLTGKPITSRLAALRD